MPPEAWTFLLPVCFALWWSLVLWFAAWIGGWAALARHYRATGQFDGRTRRFRSGRVGWGNYNGVLVVGSNENGLYLRVLMLFRPGHPPLFIPWSDLTPHVKRTRFFGDWLEFHAEQTPRVKLLLPADLAKDLAADANRAWDTSRSE